MKKKMFGKTDGITQHLVDHSRAERTGLIVCIVGLLVIRYPYLILNKWFPYGFEQTLLMSIFYTVTYLFSGWFLFIERKRLTQYNVTRFFLILFLSLPTVTPVVMVLFFHLPVGSIAPYSPRIVLSVVFTVLFRQQLFSTPPVVSGKRITYSSLWTFFLSLPLMLITAGIAVHQSRILHMSIPIEPYMNMVPVLLAQMTNAALSEEPLFRGVILSFFSKHLPSWAAVSVQTLLFTLAHLYYVSSYPFSFWLIVPIGGMVFGVIATKTKSLTYSTVSHGLGNSISRLFAIAFQSIWK